MKLTDEQVQVVREFLAVRAKLNASVLPAMLTGEVVRLTLDDGPVPLLVELARVEENLLPKLHIWVSAVQVVGA